MTTYDVSYIVSDGAGGSINGPRGIHVTSNAQGDVLRQEACQEIIAHEKSRSRNERYLRSLERNIQIKEIEVCDCHNDVDEDEELDEEEVYV